MGSTARSAIKVVFSLLIIACLVALVLTDDSMMQWVVGSIGITVSILMFMVSGKHDIMISMDKLHLMRRNISNLNGELKDLLKSGQIYVDDAKHGKGMFTQPEFLGILNDIYKTNKVSQSQIDALSKTYMKGIIPILIKNYKFKGDYHDATSYTLPGEPLSSHFSFMQTVMGTNDKTDMRILKGKAIVAAVNSARQAVQPYINAINTNYIDIDAKLTTPDAKNVLSVKTPGIVPIDSPNTITVVWRKYDMPSDHNPHTRSPMTLSDLQFRFYDKHVLNNVHLDPCSWIDDKWFVKMADYIANLEPQYKLTLESYTCVGDQFVNNYLRGKLDLQTLVDSMRNKMYWNDQYYKFGHQMITMLMRTDIDVVSQYMARSDDEIIKLIHDLQQAPPEDQYSIVEKLATNNKFTKRFAQDVIIAFMDDLNAIIQNAPALSKEMVVFRGCQEDFINPIQGQLYQNKGFISTTINVKVAFNFAISQTPQLQRIILPPGSKAIFMMGISKFPDESEILLGSDTLYYIATSSRKIVMDTYTTGSIPSEKNINITDYVAINP